MDFFEVIWDFFLKLEVVKICFTLYASFVIPRNEESPQETRQQCVLNKWRFLVPRNDKLNDFLFQILQITFYRQHLINKK